LIDADHRIVFANPAFHINLGLTDGSLSGKMLRDVWSTAKYQELQEGYQRASLANAETTVEIETVECDTSFELILTPFEHLFMVTCIDVSKHKRKVAMFTRQMQANKQVFDQIAQSNSKVNSDAITDVLTGLDNRRRADELADQIFHPLRDQNRPLSIIVLDIDHFKKFNDTYGHSEGDNVLRLIGQTIRKFADESETTARIGGEEFIVICPNIGLNAASLRAQILLEDIRSISGAAIPITASLGVAAVAESDKSWKDTVERADKAMYAAKHGGRNRVVVWSSEHGELGQAE